MVNISEVEKSVSESVSKLKENAENVSDESVRGSVVEELSELKSQIQEIRDRQHKLLEKNRELRETISDREQVSGSEDVQKAIDRQKNLRDDFMELKDELNSLKLKTDQIPNDYEFEDIIQDFQDKTEQLEELMPAVENAFETAQRAREEALDEEDLERTRQDLESELVSEERFGEMSNALSELKDSVNALNDNLARTRLDEAVDIASIKQQIEELRDESGSFDAEEIDDRIRKLEVSNDILESHLEEEILEAQEDLENNIYSLASAKADVEDIKQLGEEIGETKVTAGKKISDLESSLNALDMRIKSLAIDEKVDTAELETEIEKARDEITITLLDTLRGLEEETADASDMRQAQSRLEELESRADQLNEGLQSLAEQTEKARLDEAVDRSQLQSSIQDLRKQTASMHELRGVHESLETLRDKTESLRSDLTGMEIDEKIDRSELEDEIQKARDEVTISVMDTVEQLRQELATKNELRGVHETLSLFNDRHDKMKQYLDQTSDQLEALEGSTQKRFDSVHSDMDDRFNAVRSNLRQDMDDLRSDMDERADSLDSRIEQVNEKLEHQAVEEKVDRSELEEAVEDLKDEMSGVDADQVADLERRMEDMSSLMLEMVRKFSAE